ncbi:hypothetical protein NQZ68_024317 [Dissostichus eleginoides]|nr:hypothetical protein NQZ68_024317 [Dissostichus eleginoides]
MLQWMKEVEPGNVNQQITSDLDINDCPMARGNLVFSSGNEASPAGCPIGQSIMAIVETCQCLTAVKSSTKARRSRSRRRDDLYEDLVLMDQEAEQEENVCQEAISDELGLEAENVAAGEKRLAEALDDSDESDIDESDIDTFLKDC